MTPSAESKKMTAGQINKAVANYRALLEKHSCEFNSETVQSVLGQPELADEMLVVFRKRVGAISNVIVRRVHVNRSMDSQGVLDATGRTQYTNPEVMKDLPRGDGEDKEVFFFKLGRYVSDAELDEEYELRGLKSDPYAQAQANTDGHTFADGHPNGCHWKDANGRWCFIAFDRWFDGERSVVVHRGDCGWHGCWWFAGVRK